ncbi:MAG: PspC domain-containing protein [Acidimicrobiia bacterium]|nr:PspC domain-containing protein [Acidimicrobiia bacterium]MDH4366210.1 PspC domain-containing protein [Acidimicrobiia bacterium]MDH5291779.1 PspC domain-containing protein [Acidimicrobiia bacterium]
MVPVDPTPDLTPPEPASPDPPGPAYRLRRSRSDRMIAGVCGGLATALGVDPVWVRLAVLILVFGSGSGLLLYIAAWILIPEEDADNPVARHPGIDASSGSMVVGLVLVALGAALLMNRLIPWFDDVLWPLAVITAGGALLYAGSRRR